MNKKKFTLVQKTYHGSEDAVDLDRDASEAFDYSDFIPKEFTGKVTLTITYEPSEEDKKYINEKD